jgi:putative methionine-R-sulfoxide reductase with GAF domain/HD superfamily phosphohydrolase YqeK
MRARGDRELERLHHIESDLRLRINELTALYEVSKSITSATANLNKLLRLIARKITGLVETDLCMIHLLIEGKLSLKTIHARRPNGFMHKRAFVAAGNLLGKALNSKKIIRLKDLSGVSRDAFCDIARKGSVRSVLIVPLIEKGEAIGTLTCCSRKRAAYSKDDEEEISLFANQAAVAIENARLLEETRRNYLNTIKLLASVIDAKDRYTEGHSEHVVRAAMGIANNMDLSGKQKSILRYASLLHDVGKIGIDINVLRKPAPLTKKEWAQVRQHPKIGAEIIKKAGFLDDLIEAILYHHVRYAGGGYPRTRRKGDGIPVEARILAVADAYEAMRSDRPYRKRLSVENAVAELKKCSGTQFDPKVVNAFLKYLKFAQR